MESLQGDVDTLRFELGLSSQRGFKDYGADGAQILIRKVINAFQQTVIGDVMGTFGALGIFTLKQLKKWAKKNPDTNEAKVWDKVKKQLGIGSEQLGLIESLVNDGNIVAHEIQPDEYAKALACVKFFAQPVQSDVKNILTIVSSFMNK